MKKQQKKFRKFIFKKITKIFGGILEMLWKNFKIHRAGFYYVSISSLLLDAQFQYIFSISVALSLSSLHYHRGK